MTRQMFRRLAALVALAGLFAMHGFAVGHGSGECLTATHDTAAHQAPAHGASAPIGTGARSATLPYGGSAPALSQATGTTVTALSLPGPDDFVSAAAAAVIGSGVLAFGEAAVMEHGELIVRAVDCGPLGAAGMCLAVLLASILLALLLLAARRRWAVLDLDPALEHRGLPARPGAFGRIRGPSPVQLCVLRT